MFTRLVIRPLMKDVLQCGTVVRKCPCTTLLTHSTVTLHNSAVQSQPLRNQREMPAVFYYQNPFQLMKIKWQTMKLKKWDGEFDQKEFNKGSTQAVSVVTEVVKKEKLDDLQGLLTPFALSKLRRDILVLWNDDIIRNIGLKFSDIKLAVPTRIQLRSSRLQKKVCDIDMWYMAMKWRDLDALLIIDLVARFTRDFTKPKEKSEWTISFFELRKYHVQSYNKNN